MWSQTQTSRKKSGRCSGGSLRVRMWSWVQLGREMAGQGPGLEHVDRQMNDRYWLFDRKMGSWGGHVNKMNRAALEAVKSSLYPSILYEHTRCQRTRHCHQSGRCLPFHRVRRRILLHHFFDLIFLVSFGAPYIWYEFNRPLWFRSLISPW